MGAHVVWCVVVCWRWCGSVVGCVVCVQCVWRRIPRVAVMCAYVGQRRMAWTYVEVCELCIEVCVCALVWPGLCVWRDRCMLWCVGAMKWFADMCVRVPAQLERRCGSVGRHRDVVCVGCDTNRHSPPQ